MTLNDAHLKAIRNALILVCIAIVCVMSLPRPWDWIVAIIGGFCVGRLLPI